MRFPYLIWDFDGTLFDTYPPLVNSIQRALADFDITVPQEIIITLLQGTLAETLQTLTAQRDVSAGQLKDRMNYYQQQVTVRDSRPFPGAIQILERIMAAGGRNYLVTHRDAESLSALLGWYRVTGVFADIITSDDGYPRKPDPASFVAMIERHNLPRTQVLVVGDRMLDVQAGKAARVRTCLFRGLPGPGAVPDYMIATYGELETILELSSHISPA